MVILFCVFKLKFFFKIELWSSLIHHFALLLLHHPEQTLLILPSRYICFIFIYLLKMKPALFYLFLLIYFWLHWIFIALLGLALVVVSGGLSLLWYSAFLLRWLLFLWSMGSKYMGFSSCSSDPVAPWHVESSQSRNRTRVLCMGRQTVIHWATREVHVYFYCHHSSSSWLVAS